MRQPDAKKYPDNLAPIVSQLTGHREDGPLLAGRAARAARRGREQAPRANIAALYHETDAAVVFEGSTGVSPREIRTVLLDAAQSGLRLPLAVRGAR
jgi:serine protein kinase